MTGTKRIRLHTALAVLFVSVLWLPIWQWKWQLIQEQPLAGEEKAIEVVPLTLATWFDLSFQRSFEARQARKLSFRGHLVRSNNQLNVDLFGDVVPKVRKGTDDELFESGNHPRKAWFTGDVMASRERLRKLAKLQDYLSTRKVALLVMITPSNDGARLR